MGEGRAELAGSLNTVRTMATRDIYETGFDEDVRSASSANQCPECDGWVATNAVETVCEDCGIVIDEQRIDHGPEWRACDDEERSLFFEITSAGGHRLVVRIGLGSPRKIRPVIGSTCRKETRLFPPDTDYIHHSFPFI